MYLTHFFVILLVNFTIVLWAVCKIESKIDEYRSEIKTFMADFAQLKKGIRDE